MNTEKQKRWEGLGGGIYKDNRSGKFYHRPVIGGKPTFRLLDVANVTAARQLKAKLDTQQAMHEHGLQKDPYAADPPTVGELLVEYKKAGCPLKGQRVRGGHQLAAELSRIKKLESFWNLRRADQVKPKDCSAYFNDRKSSMKAGFSGGRAVDMELTTLCGVFNWGVYNGKLDVNPIMQRPKFREGGDKIKHCREFMPKDAAELHALARALFADKRSEALGWQLLLEAMTGCRTNEILRLRWDAQNCRQAGWIDQSHLWLNRSKKGINPWVEIYPALADTIKALQNWRVWRGRANSPWFIPSHNPAHPVAKCSLTHALKRIAPGICGEHRTSHGLRAFYVTVRRSMGIMDGQIAAEIGDATGAAMISSTYGAIPPDWQGGTKLSWSVESPAWTVLAIPENVLQIQAVV